MNGNIDAVFVHFHSGAWLVSAIQALRADWRENGLAGRIIVVDNGSTPAERAAFPGLEATVIDTGSNLGFAAGVNLGVAAGSAPLVMLVNPDVQVVPGCSRALFEALRTGAAVAGPRLYWDSQCQFLLPATEPVDRRYRLLRRAGRHNARCLRQARAIWRKHTRRSWRAAAALPSRSLSGALLALRRDAWNVAGPFDEGFFMYFEETEWLHRLRRHRLGSLHVPSARAIHFYARSTPDVGAARQHYRASEQRFFDHFHGAATNRILERLAAWLPPSAVAAPRPWNPRTGNLARQGRSRRGCRNAWIELSPSAEGFPAAGHWWPESEGDTWRMPDDVWMNLPAGDYSIAITNDDDRETNRYGFTKHSAG